MEQTEIQPEITEEKPSQDISAGETKVSDQRLSPQEQSAVDKHMANYYRQIQELKGYKADYEDLRRQNEELETEISRTQDKAYADDPDMLRDAKAKREFFKAQREHEREKKALEEAKIAVGLQMKALDVAEISQRYGVSKKVLEKADVRSKSELEEFAKEIKGELSSKPQSKETPGYDPGISNAPGEGRFTRESIANMTPEQIDANWDAIQKAWREEKLK